VKEAQIFLSAHSVAMSFCYRYWKIFLYIRQIIFKRHV